MEEDFSPIIEKKKNKRKKDKHEELIDKETVVLRENTQQQNLEVISGESEKIADDIEQPNVIAENTTNEKQSKPKRKFGLKPFTFFSGVFDIVVGAVLGVLCGMLVGPMTSWIGDSELAQFLAIIISPLIWVFFLLGFGLAIMFVILGISSLISSFKSDKKNLNGLVITTIVFECILLPLIIFLTIFGESDSHFPLFISMVVIIFVSIIFKIVDLILIRRRGKKYYEQVKEFEKAEPLPNFDALKKTEKQGEKSENDESDKPDGHNGVDFSALSWKFYKFKNKKIK